MSAKRLPSVRAMLHIMSSWYTQGVAPRNTTTDPPVMAARSTPSDVASARPSGARPRTSTRVRQMRSVLKKPMTIHASRIEGAPSWPSSPGVRITKGIRSREGNTPKYVNCRPSCTNASMPSLPLGIQK